MGPSPRRPGLYGLLCTSLVKMNGFGPTSLGVWIHSFLCFSRHVVWKGERPWLRQVCLWPLVEVEPRAPSQCANTWRPKLRSGLSDLALRKDTQFGSFKIAIGKDIPRQSEFQSTLGRRYRIGPSTLRPCFAM